MLTAPSSSSQEVQSRLRRRRAKGGKMLASDMRRVKIAVGMAGACVIDRDIRRRHQSGMLHRSILDMKAIQLLCQKAFFPNLSK